MSRGLLVGWSDRVFLCVPRYAPFPSSWECLMAWTKPQFKVVSLCMEITLYAHNR